MKLTLLFCLITSTFTFAQLQYAGGEFIPQALIITSPDTIYAGNQRSFDNGETWTEIFTGTGSLDNYYSSAIGIVEKNDSLYRTDDFGNTWTDISYLENLKSVKYSDDQNTLYAYTASNYMDGSSVKPVSHIYKSTDEGSTWNEITLPFSVLEGDSLACQNMNVLSEDTLLLAMRAAGPSYTLPAYLFSSYDGGMTWDTTSMEYHTVNRMQFLTAEVGYFAGFNFLYKTVDAGLTWEVQELCPEIKDIEFVNSNVGFVTGIVSGSCLMTTLKTNNGGTTWEEMTNCTPCDGEDQFIGFQIDALDENNVLFSGPLCIGVYRYNGLSCLELNLEEQELDFISVYPNPVKSGESLSIQNNYSEELEYSIYDLSGRIIKSGKMIGNETLLMDNIKAGTYVIHTSRNGELRNQLFIVS